MTPQRLGSAAEPWRDSAPWMHTEDQSPQKEWCSPGHSDGTCDSKYQKSLRIRSPNWLNEDRWELCYYRRTRSTSGLVWSIFFLSSGSFLAIAVSSQFEKDCMMNRNTLNIGLIQRSNNIKPCHLENGSTDKNNWHTYIYIALFNGQVNFNIMHNESVSSHLTFLYI